jgi:hypothetical protein
MGGVGLMVNISSYYLQWKHEKTENEKENDFYKRKKV